MNVTLARRMIGSEVLKLRRSRSIMAFAAFLTIGVVVIAYGYTALRHSSSPLQHRPAGGIKGFNDGVRALGDYFGMLAAILIGSEAGTLDRASGVFRDLVVTGRSRLALFAVRLPAALIVSYVLVWAAYAITVAVAFVFAGGEATPSASLILQSLGWLTLADTLLVCLGVGVGSLTGSRALTITGLIGWQAVITALLLNIGSLGSVRDGLLSPALDQLSPIPHGDGVTIAMSTALAVIVITLWAAIPTFLGAWRTRIQDA